MLRLITAGMAADNFGHSQHDVLWPFIAAVDVLEQLPRRGTTVYVLEIGVFVLRRLREAFPDERDFKFEEFQDVYDVPMDAEEILITGLGAPKEFDPPCIWSSHLDAARNRMRAVCGLAPLSEANGSCSTCSDAGVRPTRIMVVERRLTAGLRNVVDETATRSIARDNPALKHYYDGGMWQHHVTSCKRILGGLRRSVLNHDEVLAALRMSFSEPMFEVVSFNPEEHSFCEQLRMFADAQVLHSRNMMLSLVNVL